MAPPPGRFARHGRIETRTSADATAEDLARLVREHWSIEAHRYIRGSAAD